MSDERSIEELIEASSLGTPEAKAIRESVPIEMAQEIVRRAKVLAHGLDRCTCWPHGPDEACTCDGCWACAGAVVGSINDHFREPLQSHLERHELIRRARIVGDVLPADNFDHLVHMGTGARHIKGVPSDSKENLAPRQTACQTADVVHFGFHLSHEGGRFFLAPQHSPQKTHGRTAGTSWVCCSTTVLLPWLLSCLP